MSLHKWSFANHVFLKNRSAIGKNEFILKGSVDSRILLLHVGRELKVLSNISKFSDR